MLNCKFRSHSPAPGVVSDNYRAEQVTFTENFVAECDEIAELVFIDAYSN